MARLERIVERLELKEFQLRALLDVTKAINANMDRGDLLALYERIVREDLGITRLMLFEKAERWERILSYGHTGRAEDLDVERIFSAYQDIQVINSESAGSLGAFDVAVPVYHREQPLAFLLIGDIDEEEQRMSPTVKHLNFIQTLTNLIVVAMENKRLARQALLQERARRELELAAEMQSMLVPRELPNDSRIQADAWYQPHGQVGGDYYDLVRLNEDELVLCVADVSGKGMAAALLMSNFQANIRALAHEAATDLPALVALLNDKVNASARGERFITLFIAHADLRTRRLRYVSAGHNAALLQTGAGIARLSDGCVALGMLPSLPFLKPGERDLPPGSTLLCYTDGLVEQENAAGEELGTQEVERLLTMHESEGPARIGQALKAAYELHRGDQPFLDDIAVLTCRFE
ncbi:MAG: PP2C family protein-serine/threonine phosphatase [Flavobacteriales bacterium]|nr:PP2C family protein-serine/threonine phosphatase [Flavobacteriales bacterium]